MSEDPFKKFGEWFAAAEGAEPNDPNAMTVATVGENGRPSVRILLLKSWDKSGFSFYGNLGSRKAREMHANNHVALLFHWKSLARQVRIEGTVTQVSGEQADAYFATRPRICQIGAWASEQSRPLPSRELFESRVEEAGDPLPGPARAAPGVLVRLEAGAGLLRVLAGDRFPPARPLHLHPDGFRLGDRAALPLTGAQPSSWLSCKARA